MPNDLESAQVIVQLNLKRTGGVIAAAKSSIEKALLIEAEFGMDPLFSLIACGESEHQIADNLGITHSELRYILTRTAKYRSEYAMAQAFLLSQGSVGKLKSIGRKTWLSKHEKYAATHHRQIFLNVARLLNAGIKSNDGSNIVVHNTVVVQDKEKTPELPDGLNKIIEAEYADSTT